MRISSPDSSAKRRASGEASTRPRTADRRRHDWRDGRRNPGLHGLRDRLVLPLERPPPPEQPLLPGREQ